LTRIATTATANSAPRGKTNGNGHAVAAEGWRAIALEYIAHFSVYPVPLLVGTVRPTCTGWNLPEHRITKKNIDQYFDTRAGGVGVLLGAPCGERPGLMDVDLDWPETRRLAEQFLPTTKFIFGRKSNPASHYTYSAEQCAPTTAYKDPFWKKGDAGHETLVELKGTANNGHVGYFARIPPSLHKSGEIFSFTTEPEFPALVDITTLQTAVARLAAVALLTRHWPGGHEPRMALIGLLADLGLTEEDTTAFVAAMGVKPKEAQRHTKRTYELKAKDAPYTAAPRLEELLGDKGPKIVKVVCEWLSPKSEEATAINAQFHINTVVTTDLLKPLEQALALDPTQRMFQQKTRLVRVCEETKVYTEDDPYRRALGNTFISPVTQLGLERALNGAGLVFKKDRHGKKQAANVPSKWCAQILDRARDAYGLPWLPLKAIRSVPFLLDDGSLIDKPGYHAPTGIWLDEQFKFPSPPERPDKEEARASLDKFAEIFSQYNFVPVAGEAWDKTPSYAVVLSTILSILGRNLLPTVMGQGTTSFRPGSGKTDLNRAQAILTTGSDPFTLGYVNQKEFDKHIPVPLIAGDRVVLIDNVDQMLRSTTLNTMLTLPSSTAFQVRPLGQTASIPVENHTVVMANGNHLAIFGDMERRWLQVDLNPGCDAPEDRKFTFNPVERAHEMFPELAVAGLTALRYWVQAGCPAQDYGEAAPEAGSYREWNRAVRGLLVHLGFGDPMLTRARVKENNPQRHDESALMEGFYRISPHGEPFTLHDIPQMAKTLGSTAELVHSLLCEKGVWNPMLAHWKVRRILGQSIDGKRLVSDGENNANKMRYRVEVDA
jgi:hypothetical protein